MKVRELLDKPEKWTTNALARDASGKPIDPGSSRAACWCLNGAIDKCYPVGDKRAAARAKLKAAIRSRRGDYSSITWFNDYQAKKFEDVKAVLATADV